MNEQNFPRLEQLHVLRTSALASIRDRAFDTLPLSHIDYGDGIVSGCQLKTNKDSIAMQPGIVYFQGFMYFIQEPMRIAYAPADEYRVLKLRFSVPEETENFIRRSVMLLMSSNVELQTGELELCRFKLKSGAVLRTEYVDFFDRLTEFDTVNDVACLYASVGGNTISPGITEAFAREAMNYELAPLDQCFCMEALGGKPVRREQISFYLLHRLKQKLPSDSNEALFDGLCQALQMIQSGNTLELLQKRRGRREVLVD